MVHGTHGDMVDEFLDEVRATTVERWRVFVEEAAPGQATIDATRATTQLALSAATLASVDAAAHDAYRGLALDRSSFESRMHTGRISTSIRVASRAIAGHDQLDPHDLNVLLRPFAVIGFRSVAGLLAPS